MATGENLGAKFTLDISNLKAGLSEANKMIRQSESEFIEAAAGMNNWSKSADGLSLRVETLNKQIDIQKSKISALIKVKDETIEKMKKEGASNEEIAAAVDKVNSQLSKEQKQLETLQGKADKAGKELEEFNTAENDAADGSKELEKGVESAGKAAEKAGNGGFTVLKGVLANLVTGALRAAAGALKNFAGSVLETGMSFDSAMSNVAALSGATGEDLEKLTETARKFGATTQFSATEAADALGYMALAGWDANESTAALGGVLDLAAASGLGLAQASDMVTDYLSAFGMSAEQSAEFADLLAYAQANSNTSAEQLGEAYKNCAANLNAAGQDVQTVTALLSSMANQGLKGATAGTALSAVMRDMTKKMEDGKIKIGDQSIAVMDASGNFRDLTEILADVNKATEGMGDAEKSAALMSTFTSDSIKGLNLILNEGVDNAAAFEEQLRNSSGSAAEMAKTLNDNLSGDLKNLNSAFDEFKLTIFESANAPLRGLVQEVTNGVLPALTDMIKGVDGADAAFGEAVGHLVKTALDNLTQLLPSMLNVVNTLIPSLIQTVLSQIPTLLTFLLTNVLPSIIKTIGEMLPKILTAVVSMIPLIAQSIIDGVPLILDAAINLFSALIQALPQIFTALVEELPALITEFINALVSFTDQITNGAITLLTAIVDALPVIISSLIAALPSLIDAIIGGLTAAIPQLLDAGIRLFMAIIQAIPTIISELIKALPQIITTITISLLKNLPAIINCAIQLFGGILKAIPQIIVELVKALPQIITAIVQGLTGSIGQIVNAGKQLLAGLWRGLTEGLSKRIKSFGESIVNGFKDFFKIHSPSVRMRDEIGYNLGAGTINGFVDSVKQGAATMQNALNAAMPKATAAVNFGGFTQQPQDGGRVAGGAVVINQTNNYSQQHSRFEIYQSKKATAAAVRAALSEV